MNVSGVLPLYCKQVILKVMALRAIFDMAVCMTLIDILVIHA